MLINLSIFCFALIDYRIVENKLQNKIPFELQLHFGMYLSNFKFYEYVVMLR